MTEKAPIVDIPANPRPEGVEAFWFTGVAGKRIRACAAPASRGTPARGSALICPGRTEFLEKYFEVARELQARGFAVLIMDVRGQGLSDRFMDDRLPGHIDSIDFAALDFAAALTKSPVALPKPFITFAHSMGGAIVLRCLQKKRLEALGAVFSAPMWGVNELKGVQLFGAKVMNSLGLGKNHPPGAQSNPEDETFEENPCTHDRRRWELARAIIAANKDLALGGVTIGWAVAAAEAIKLLQAPANLKALKTPILVFSAAEEKLVANWSHALIARRAPNVDHVTIDGAMHEILQETDAVRTQFWARTDAFLDKLVPHASAAVA